MGIEYTDDTAVLSGTVSVDDAETLLQWLQGRSSGPVDLGACTHLHAANLQVLMAARAVVTVFPDNSELAALLGSVLKPSETPRAAR